MRRFITESFAIHTESAYQWRRALRVSIAIGIPLVIALYRGEFLPAVYGGVAGLYSIFVDNGGRTFERIVAIIYMTVGMLLCGIAGVVGHSVPGASLAFLLAFSILTGWLQGTGAAVELMSKYWLIAFFFGDSNPHLPALAGSYLLLGGLTSILSVLIDRWLARKPEPQFGPMLFEAMSRMLRRRHSNSYFTCYFTCKILIGYAIAYGFGLTRAYWVPLTITLITVYDPQGSLPKLAQRLFGSIIGALIGWAALTWCHDEAVLAGIAVLLGALTALTLNRNYWLAAIPITAFVMVLLDFGAPQGSTLLASARMINTLIGCAVDGVITWLFIYGRDWLPPEARQIRR